MKKQQYEVPFTEVIILSMETAMLGGSSGDTATNIPDTGRDDYGDPIELNW